MTILAAKADQSERQRIGLQFWHRMDKVFTANTLIFTEALGDYFEQERLELIERLEEFISVLRAPRVPNPIQLSLALEVFREQFDPVYLSILLGGGNEALLLIGLQPQFNASTTAVARFFAQRVTRVATSITANTNTQLKRVLRDSINEGADLRTMQNRITGVYSHAKGYRSENIARTETIKASNYAAKEGWKQSGVVEAKEWFTNPGACNLCLPLHGKIIGLDDSYFKKGDTVMGLQGEEYTLSYDDVGEPDLHPQGRCTILPVMIQV